MPDITATRPAAGAPIESAWGGQVHDMLEGLQYGKFTLTWTNSAVSDLPTITFPRAYAAAPIMVAIVNQANVAAFLRQVTATTFQVQARDVRETLGSFSADCHWIAVGTPA